MMVSSEEISEASSDLKQILLDIMNDRGMLAPFLLYTLSEITNPEHTSQLKLTKDHNLNRFDNFY